MTSLKQIINTYGLTMDRKNMKEIRDHMKVIRKEREINKNYFDFVIVYYSEGYRNPWRLEDYLHLDLFKFGPNYTFGGYINIEDYELDAKKYNV